MASAQERNPDTLLDEIDRLKNQVRQLRDALVAYQALVRLHRLEINDWDGKWDQAVDMANAILAGIKEPEGQ
jgi:chromosome segregation ATPase